MLVSVSATRQVYILFQEPVEQPPLGFSIAEEIIRQLLNIYRECSHISTQTYVLKGKLPIRSKLFLFCSFLGDFIGGWGDAKVDSRPVFHRLKEVQKIQPL